MSNKEYTAELRKPAIETVRKPLLLSTEAAAAFHAAITTSYQMVLNMVTAGVLQQLQDQGKAEGACRL